MKSDRFAALLSALDGANLGPQLKALVAQFMFEAYRAGIEDSSDIMRVTMREAFDPGQAPPPPPKTTSNVYHLRTRGRSKRRS
jgi:hypothetical protein